ncbi:MAG: extracellular solute-binding protein family 1 [Paenibacillus sp.]|nr:extracellular solute-binding protein family 1 [Paenibacillus sp.]
MKRKSWKKASVTTLAVALAAGSLLAACSGGGSGGKEAAAGKEGEKAPEKKPKITVTIYDRGQVPQGEGDYVNNRWTRWINENAPVEVEFVPVPRTGEAAKLNTLFASNTAPDLIQTYLPSYRNDLYTSKQIIPLDDLIEKHSTNYKALMKQYPLLKKLGYKSDGKIYELGRVTGLQQNVTVVIRQDWLKKLNLDMPKTTDELFKVMKAFAEMDPDGNGKKDTFGYNLSGNGNEVINAIFGSDTWHFDANGKLYHDYERAEAALAFKKQIYDAGIADKDYLTDKGGTKAQQDWVNGKLGIYASVKITSNLALHQTFKKNNPTSEVAVLELPKGPFGQFSPQVDTPAGSVGVVNANAKDPVAVMKYIDWLISESTLRTLKYGFEGEHWKMGKNGCPEPIDLEKNKKELDWNYEYYTLFGNTVLLGKCGDPSSSYDLSDPVQKELADLYAKGKEVWLSKSRPVFKDVGFMPALPKDLQLISTNGFKYEDLFQKAIVSGPSYTVEQAVKEAKEMWEKAGGQKVDEFYTKYYAENKDKVYMAKIDAYDIK